MPSARSGPSQHRGRPRESGLSPPRHGCGSRKNRRLPFAKSRATALQGQPPAAAQGHESHPALNQALHALRGATRQRRSWWRGGPTSQPAAPGPPQHGRQDQPSQPAPPSARPPLCLPGPPPSSTPGLPREDRADSRRLGRAAETGHPARECSKGRPLPRRPQPETADRWPRRAGRGPAPPRSAPPPLQPPRCGSSRGKPFVPTSPALAGPSARQPRGGPAWRTPTPATRSPPAALGQRRAWC